MTAPFAWHEKSPVMLAADGDQILAYDSKDQGPRWLTPAPGPVKRVRCSSERAFALCEGGQVLELDLQRGEVLSRQTVEGARELALTPRGAVAIVTATGVVFEATTLPVKDASHVCFSSDGTRALVVSGDGTLHLFDTGTAAELGTLAITQPAPASLAAWNPLHACWLVVAGTHVKKVQGNLSSFEIFASFEQPFSALSVEPTGRAVALRAGPAVLLLGFPNRELIGNLSYFDKTPGEVAFGPSPWVGIGLDGGDANTVNMTEEGIYRSDPHAGRVRNRWMLSVNVDPAVTAKVLPPIPPPSNPIAAQLDAQAARLKELTKLIGDRPPAPPPAPPSRAPAFLLFALVAGALLLLLATR